MKSHLIFSLFYISMLTSANSTELIEPTKWDLMIIDSANVLTDTITNSDKDFWINENSYTLQSYMFDFTVNYVSDGIYFATYRLPVPPSTTNNGIGFIVSDNNGYIHVSPEPVGVPLAILVNDTLRFAYNSNSAAAYLYNTRTYELVQVVLGEHKDEYSFKSGLKITSQTPGSSYADSNSKKTLASYGDIYDMSSLHNNEDAFVTFIKTLSLNSIPEPATATLSLLALTALAARRRRK